MTIRSAFLPHSRLPYRSSSSSARAPHLVAIRRISCEGTTVGSRRQPLWIRLVSHISSTMSMWLEEDAPSVPMEGRSPIASIFGIREKPSTRMAEAGLWEIFTSRFLNSSSSSSVSHTV